MAYARYVDEVSSVLRATITANNLVIVTPSYQSSQPLVQVAMDFCGGTASIEPFDYFTWAYTLPYNISGEGWPQAAQDAFTTWADALPAAQSADSMAIGYLFRARANVLDATSDLYLCSGVAERFHPGHMPAKYFELYGPTNWSLNATWSLDNVYVKGQITNATSIYRQTPRRWTDRTLSCRLYADGQSRLELSFGAATAANDLAYLDEEFLIGGSAGAMTSSITLQTVPSLNTSFADISAIKLGDGSISFSHANFDDYTTDGSTWTRTAAGAKFHGFVANGKHDLQMVATGVSGSVSHSCNSELVGPIRYYVRTGRYGPANGWGRI